MFKKERSIKNRIFRDIFALVLLIFGSIILIFNLCIKIYIGNIAGEQLRNISQIKNGIEIEQDKARMFQMVQTQLSAAMTNVNNIRTENKSFIVNSNYEVVEWHEKEEAKLIIEKIRQKNLSLEEIKEKNIRTSEGSYYVTMVLIEDGTVLKDYYLCFYVDITTITNFSQIINTVLIVVICIAMFFAAIITFILSERITNPIKKLSVLASEMGKGNFTEAQIDLQLNEIELRELSESMNKAAKQLERYDKDQKAFFQNVSHELRTPLMSIKCYAEGLKYEIMNKEKATNTIINEVNRMSQMVEDLLYVSKIDNITKSYEINKYDLREILASCTGRQKVIADDKGITFDFQFASKEVYMKCNENLISRAFTNLISNAIRHAKKYVTLVCKEEKDKIIIQIIDDGDGIAEKDLPHIFERFYKGKNGNHGIGLSIVRSIVEQNKGKVIAENSVDSGAVFTIEFKK